MRWFTLALGIWLPLAALAPAQAGIFGKKEKKDLVTHVIESLAALKNNPDADKRAEAAEDLREIDPTAFPEIVPALIEAMQKDSSSAVRREAAQTLGKLRPTSVEVLQALEVAEEKDNSAMVRWQARRAQWGYQVEKPKQAAPSPSKPSTVARMPPPSQAVRGRSSFPHRRRHLRVPSPS
jgi:hypothetical protein